MVQHCFPDLTNIFGATDACILTTLNKHVDELNARVLARQSGEEHVYKSAQFFGPDAYEEEVVYPVEVLNTLLPSKQPGNHLRVRMISLFLKKRGRHLYSFLGCLWHGTA